MDKSELILEFLGDYDKLKRKDVDAIGWIALKFSVSRVEAECLIAKARGEGKS